MSRTLSLEDLLGSTSGERFFSENWEDAPLSVERQLPDFYGRLLSLDDVDALIGLVDLPQGSLRLLRDGAEIPGKEVNRDTAFRHFAAGGTIAVNGLQRYLPGVAELAASLAEELSCPVSANIYLTPASGQGFVEHYDDHDVFILQIAGDKQWVIYADPPRPLPLRGEVHRPTPEAPVPKHGPALIDRMLRRGDLLYIPRGFVHHARSTDTTSLHITLGTHPRPWSEVFSSALKRLVDTDPRFRRSLPPGIAAAGALEPRRAASQYATLLREALAGLPIEGVVDEVVAGLRAGAQPLIGPRLRDIEAARILTPQTRLTRREGVRIDVRREEELWVLRFNQKKIDWPETAENLARFVATTPEFALSEAPNDLGESGVATCLGNLIREGALRVVRAESS